VLLPPAKTPFEELLESHSTQNISVQKPGNGIVKASQWIRYTVYAFLVFLVVLMMALSGASVNTTLTNPNLSASVLMGVILGVIIAIPFITLVWIVERLTQNRVLFRLILAGLFFVPSCLLGLLGTSVSNETYSDMYGGFFVGSVILGGTIGLVLVASALIIEKLVRGFVRQKQ
jgi:hypothetical protein